MKSIVFRSTLSLLIGFLVAFGLLFAFYAIRYELAMDEIEAGESLQLTDNGGFELVEKKVNDEIGDLFVEGIVYRENQTWIFDSVAALIKSAVGGLAAGGATFFATIFICIICKKRKGLYKPKPSKDDEIKALTRRLKECDDRIKDIENKLDNHRD